MSELFQYGSADGYRTRGIGLHFRRSPGEYMLGLKLFCYDGDAFLSVGFIFWELTLEMYRVFPPRKLASA